MPLYMDVHNLDGPVTMDDVAKAPEAYQAVTADQVKAAFAKYYVPESHITVAIKPDGTGEAPKEPTVRGTGQGAAPAKK